MKKFMDELYMRAVVKMQLAMDQLNDESGDVNVVSLVILIGVAVCLAIIFKDEITSLLQSLLKTITGKATSAVS